MEVVIWHVYSSGTKFTKMKVSGGISTITQSLRDVWVFFSFLNKVVKRNKTFDIEHIVKWDRKNK